MSNKELIEIICEEIGSNDIERMDFIEVDGIEYMWNEVEELETIDEGKYQNGGKVFSIFKDTKRIAYIQQNFTKSGSYFSHQEFEYDKPYEVEQREITKTVWRAV